MSIWPVVLNVLTVPLESAMGRRLGMGVATGVGVTVAVAVTVGVVVRL
ncbi:MAG TPA: hypothetical protein VK009_22925 [Chloroflexota bacterium]|nr:hypothetical protein [Chloroflexota bacterium]